MFSVGAHFAYSRARRHPTAKPYIFGVKNRLEIFDLEKTKGLLDKTRQYIQNLGKEGKVILFVAGKNEARTAIENGALKLGMPYVAGRWIGGTLTNFGAIRGRVDKLEDLLVQREKGELAKYTKKERLLIDRDIERLLKYFSGIRSLKKKPDAIFVIDPRREHIAVAEAVKERVPVVALLGSDCDASSVAFPMFGNDSSGQSIAYFVEAIVSAYNEGKAQGMPKA